MPFLRRNVDEHILANWYLLSFGEGNTSTRQNIHFVILWVRVKGNFAAGLDFKPSHCESACSVVPVDQPSHSRFGRSV
jgi:hypothetical protein